MDILELSQQQIEAIIFKGATPEELRSPLDHFTEEEICALPRHPHWNEFDIEFRDWMWETIGGIMSY
jgi:hypothetical protein